MILINFSHPLTDLQRRQIESLTGQVIDREIHLPTQFDVQQPFDSQLDALIAQIDLTPQRWQTEPILVNLPSLNFIAALLLADLHGRMGYFPPCVRLRPVKEAVPPRFEVAEILDLQARRNMARAARSSA
ncbi:MAG: CRISPR-associated protein Csx15 [Anaerolineae bacterium]|nr:CRISPR-associated protein Csx15 [Thermoflexales bacterium]MDW8408198.1 CRISPR-associated protein Csx15 [Anaerolineae bacterium]